MKSIIFRAACIAAIVSSPLFVFSQDYYVVVGAFAIDNKASEFRGYLPGQMRDTSYTLAENENLLDFFVLRTSDKQSASSKALQLKKAIDSWTPDKGIQGELRAEGTMSGEIKMNDIKNDDASPAAINASSSASSPANMANAGSIPPRPAGKYFKFKIETPDGLPLSAKVHHLDPEEGRELAAYSADTFVDLLQPGQTSGPMSIVCGLFGYKEIHKYIDYSHPATTDPEAYVDSQGAWVIPYKLERVEKGDVSIMYNVSFYKDAAVMRKSSHSDLDELVRMMHNNPYYEITIHAHCNGRNKREIIAPGANRNYFDADGSVTLVGTAKDLTTLRAEAIRAYLGDHGVDAERVNIFSWGASDMLVKSESPDAAVNDRIEIEFTRD